MTQPAEVFRLDRDLVSTKFFTEALGKRCLAAVLRTSFPFAGGNL